jgi:predicted glycosyl hydrolase (DUF1957 family)
MPTGHLALIIELHHRLPSPGSQVGRDWVEAAIDVYWPLLRLLVELSERGPSEQVTIAVSPSWLALAADPIGRERVRSELDRRADQLGEATSHELRQHVVDRWAGDLLAALRSVGDSGAVEVIPTTASWAWLPAFADLNGFLRAQVWLAVEEHRSVLGHPPQGIWLPHRASVPGLESLLAGAGLRYTTISAESFQRGGARSPGDVFGPMITPPGTAVFAVDPEPGPGPLSFQSADGFVASWRRRVEQAPTEGSAPPIGVTSLSAQLLAGPGRMAWFTRVLDLLGTSSTCPPTTLGRYLDRFPEGPVGRPAIAWEGFDWLWTTGVDLLDRCRLAAELVADLATARETFGPLGRRALSQMARSLLAATATDIFEAYGPPLSTVEARARIEGYLARVSELAGSLQAGRLDSGRLARLEEGPPFLADLNLAHLVPT